MRTCVACHKPDAPWFEPYPCSCSRQADGAEPIPADEHAPDCKCLGHEVVTYPVRIAKSDLTFDGKLPQTWTSKGWVLRQNGMRFYRMKMLCRDCIELEVSAQSRREEYQKLCKAARGESSQSYAQFLASQ